MPSSGFLTFQLLIGRAGTTHNRPIPENGNRPRLLQLTLRDGTCAVVVEATFPFNEQTRAACGIADIASAVIEAGYPANYAPRAVSARHYVDQRHYGRAAWAQVLYDSAGAAGTPTFQGAVDAGAKKVKQCVRKPFHNLSNLP